MYRRLNNNMIFTKARISEVFESVLANIQSSIDNDAENYVLNTNETEYVEYLAQRYKLNIPELHFDLINVESYEDDIPAEYFPRMFYTIEGKTYRKEIIRYFIPCSGNIDLLSYAPANIISIGSGGNFAIKEDSIITEFINFSNSAEEIKRNFEIEVKSIRSRYDNLTKDINDFNTSLESHIQSIFSRRKSQLLNKNNLLASLGVPLRKKQGVSTTFAIPKPQLRERIVMKPTVHEKGFKPEPCLDYNNYHRILEIINDVGKNFERLPSTYRGKSEEDIRDHILLILDPNFELGSASGETFNNIGKTDISLRYDSSVVFIAECKYWKGEKGFIKTIDQLLGYLTWRNSKAAIINFVQNREFSDILSKLKSAIIQHPNFIKELGDTDQTWFNYKFHLNGDRNRELDIAIISFHLPK